MANRARMQTTRKTLVREIRPHADQAAALLKALANEQRLLILCHLQDGPLSVGELNERVDLSQSALSQHLGVLRESGIVSTTREALAMYIHETGKTGFLEGKLIFLSGSPELDLKNEIHTGRLSGIGKAAGKIVCHVLQQEEHAPASERSRRSQEFVYLATAILL